MNIVGALEEKRLRTTVQNSNKNKQKPSASKLIILEPDITNYRHNKLKGHDYKHIEQTLSKHEDETVDNNKQ